MVTRSVFSGNSVAGVETDAGGQVGLKSSTVSLNATGLLNSGAMRVSDSDISFNTTAISGSVISSGDNNIYGNGSPGMAPTVGAASTDHGKQ